MQLSSSSSASASASASAASSSTPSSTYWPHHRPYHRPHHWPHHWPHDHDKVVDTYSLLCNQLIELYIYIFGTPRVEHIIISWKHHVKLKGGYWEWLHTISGWIITTSLVSDSRLLKRCVFQPDIWIWPHTQRFNYTLYHYIANIYRHTSDFFFFTSVYIYRYMHIFCEMLLFETNFTSLMAKASLMPRTESWNLGTFSWHELIGPWNLGV